MSPERYSVTLQTLLTRVKSGEIAIPEIQRPFVWDATKVRNLRIRMVAGKLDVPEAAVWLPDEADESETLDDFETESSAADAVASDTDGVPEKVEA